MKFKTIMDTINIDKTFARAFKRTLLFFIFIVVMNIKNNAYGQVADSLLQSIGADISGKARVDTLNKLGFSLVFSNPTEARQLFTEADRLADVEQYPEGKVIALKNKAISFDLQGNSNEAIHYYMQALPIYEILKDTVGISKLKNNIGIAYKNLGDNKQARLFYYESITLKQQMGDLRGVAYGYNNMGELFDSEKEFTVALNFFHKAYQILDSLNDMQGRSATLSNLGDTYLELKNYKLAINYIDQAAAIEVAAKDHYDLALSYCLLAQAYIGLDKLGVAKVNIEKAEKLAQTIGALKIFYQSQLIKAELMKRSGDIRSLPAQYEKILLLNDSLVKINMVEETARVKAIYESKQKEITIENLKKESVLNQALLENQKQRYVYSILMIVLLVALLVIIIFFYKTSRRKRKELQFEITEREKIQETLKASEERLKLQIERMPIGQITWTSDFKASSWNPMAEQIFGFKEKEMLGRHPYEILVPLKHQLEVEAIWARLLQGDASAHSINYNITKDGRTIICEWTNTPLRNKEGKIFAVLSMVSDITQRKKAEEELILAKEQAETANRAKSEFLANMSHEIRTPMNAILGFSEILTEQLTDARLKSYVEQINGAGKNLLTLINDILDLSKIEAGKIEIIATDVNLETFVGELKSMFKLIQEQKKIEFNLELSPALPDQIHIDGIRLRQILFNLLGNAFKFTEQGSVTLQVFPSNHDQISFVVIDTGIGIPVSQHELIFEAFRQQDGQSNRKYGGTGLGLTITKRLAELLGGSISLHSIPEKGSTFTVTVPYKINNESILKIEHESPKKTHMQNEVTILVAEDNEPNRILLCEVLNTLGYKNVFEVTNGNDAVEAAIREQPSIIFMDLMMPGIDGYEANKRIKENKSTAHIPVIAWTAAGMKSDEPRIKAEFNALLRKPARMAEVEEVLRTFLKK